MNILVATGVYPPQIGGPATHAVFLEERLPAQGVYPTVVPYRIVKNVPKIFRHVAYVCVLLFKSRTQDCVYALDTISVGVPALLVSLCTRKPLILRVPGDYAWEQGQQRFGITVTLDEFLTLKHYPRMVRILRWLQTQVACHAAQVIVPSDYMKRVVEAWGVPQDRITRVYSVLKDMHVTESKKNLRERFGYKNFVVTSAARLVPWKGMQEVISAVCTLREMGHDISLYIIGEGRLFNELTTLIKKSSAQSFVHMLGAMSHHEVGERVKASDMFILNTSYEGMSHHLLEAMSVGTPVATTAVGGNRELIENGVTGLFFTFDQKAEIISCITRLMREQALGTLLSEHAQKKLRIFDEETSVKSIVEVIQKVWNFSQ